MPKLPNYLKSHRKRIGLSQKEVAFLLGTESGSHVSRAERHARQPNLQTAIAYQIVYQKSSQDLFGGIYLSIQKNVCKQARKLRRQIESNENLPRQSEKIRFLKRLETLSINSN